MTFAILILIGAAGMTLYSMRGIIKVPATEQEPQQEIETERVFLLQDSSKITEIIKEGMIKLRNRPNKVLTIQLIFQNYQPQSYLLFTTGWLAQSRHHEYLLEISDIWSDVTEDNYIASHKELDHLEKIVHQWAIKSESEKFKISELRLYSAPNHIPTFIESRLLKTFKTRNHEITTEIEKIENILDSINNAHKSIETTADHAVLRRVI